jgi:hypothetical protein
MKRHRIYYKEEGGGLFPSSNHMNVMGLRQIYDPKLVLLSLPTCLVSVS